MIFTAWIAWVGFVAKTIDIRENAKFQHRRSEYRLERRRLHHFRFTRLWTGCT